MHQHFVIWHQAVVVQLGLVDGGHLVGQALERPEVAIAAEGVAIERHLVEIAAGHKRLHVAAIVGDFLADAAELLVGQLQHTRQAAHIALVLDGDFHVALVAHIVLHIGPHVLQGAAHLQFEARLVELRHRRVVAHRLGYAADVVQRHISKAVYFKHLALVDRVVPVDVEHTLHQCRDDVHLVAEEGDDARAEDVGDVVEGTVFVAFQFQLAGQAFLALDARLKAGDDDILLVKAPAQRFEHQLLDAVKDRQFGTILVEYHFAVHIEHSQTKLWL